MMLQKAELDKIHSPTTESDRQNALIFSALGDISRFRIFGLLIKYGELCVTDISNLLEISLPAASQHLKVMDHSGLLNKERKGQTICYMINKSNPIIQSLIDTLHK